MLKKVLLGKIAYNLFANQAQQILKNNKDTQDLIDHADKKATRNKNSLESVWGQFKLLLQMLNSYRTGEYKEISKSTMVIIATGLIYFLSPVDVIPDFLIGIGLIDDAVLIGLISKQIKKDISLYEQWLEKEKIQTIESEI